MKKPKVLITSFGLFIGCLFSFLINVSNWVGKELVELMKDEYDVAHLKIKTKWFGFLIHQDSKQQLQKLLDSKQYDYVISLGQGGLFYIIERRKETSKYNIVRIHNTKKQYLCYFKQNEMGNPRGACYQTRDLLFDNAKRNEFLWEFIHIPIWALFCKKESANYILKIFMSKDEK